MSSKKTLASDVPWRASEEKPIPKIHHPPILRLPSNPTSNYALAVMKHPDPIGDGLATEAFLEAAGPECVIPGQVTPIRLLGLKVWPVEVNLKFMEPVSRELRSIGKFMDSAFNLMQASFSDR
ncbi:uncharacterized protein LOC105420255 [Amborella trichopoda]|uniref:uncharacterized protein LOC105420255 n=1 Tax=Amborella trichopoda TaxID=13333 RepID=UPI0005D3CA14|nr:uncharacterized protein LOC105420255 [Amborella trichopoda]|eukprot:XP_011621563.1 uncharacterized protein LOC105420255 [Amborella trichopoda]